MLECEKKLSEILMVREYLDVFPKDILKFPLEKEIEFSIELVPEIGSIFIAHRMPPLELVELKKQIEELIEKQFIKPTLHQINLLAAMIFAFNGYRNGC